ncbi:hypothetical protein AWB73_00119 [Caballeronia turbans]|jgi:hypothetical protein|nr:hypothetical protein AWB73_00119 [Caballeronia turbans]
MNVTAISSLKKFHLVTAASTNINSLAAVPTGFDGFSGWATVTCYLKVFDKASAPVLGTDVPAMTFMLPANVPQRIDFGVETCAMKNGLQIAVTLNPADNDTTVLAAANTSGVDVFYSPQSGV